MAVSWLSWKRVGKDAIMPKAARKRPVEVSYLDGKVFAVAEVPGEHLSRRETIKAFSEASSIAMREDAGCSVSMELDDKGAELKVELPAHGGIVLSLSVSDDGRKVTGELVGTGVDTTYEYGNDRLLAYCDAMKRGLSDLVRRGDGASVIEDVVGAFENRGHWWV